MSTIAGPMDLPPVVGQMGDAPPPAATGGGAESALLRKLRAGVTETIRQLQYTAPSAWAPRCHSDGHSTVKASQRSPINTIAR